MSYFNNAPSSGAPLAFPSYNQGMGLRNISSLSSLASSVNQLQLQYNGLHLPPQNSEAQTARELPLSAQNAEADQSQAPAPQTSSDSNSEPSLTLASLGKEKNYMEPTQKAERKNRPGQKFGAKKSSWVWTWFVQDLTDPNVAVCDFCGKVITRMPSDKGLPKKLSEHLRTHKLLKNLINTSRAIPIDGNGITYSMPYSGQLQTTVPQQIQLAHMGMSMPMLMPQLTVLGTPQKTQPPKHTPPQMGQGGRTNTEEFEPKQTQFRRTNGYNEPPPPQNSQNSIKYDRRYVLPKFDNTPYLASKFHKHLLTFLAENKLSIRLLKLQLFQQLIYDLRPDSLADLLELSGLYSSFIEVARVDNEREQHESHSSALAEASVVSTLAQELTKK